jgi:hypothetical protein
MKSFAQIAGLGLLALASGAASAQTMPGSNPYGSKPTATAMGDEQQDKGLDRMNEGLEGPFLGKSNGRPTKPTAADFAVGARIRDVNGQPAGTIDAVAADGVVVDVGQSKVRLPLTSFWKDNSGLLIGITAAKFKEIVAKAYAATGAAAPAKTGPRPATAADLVAGAQLRDVNGQPIGVITAVAADGATVDTGKTTVRLPLESFGVDSSGLKIPITAQKLNEIIARSDSTASKK